MQKKVGKFVYYWVTKLLLQKYMLLTNCPKVVFNTITLPPPPPNLTKSILFVLFQSQYLHFNQFLSFQRSKVSQGINCWGCQPSLYCFKKKLTIVSNQFRHIFLTCTFQLLILLNVLFFVSIPVKEKENMLNLDFKSNGN